MDSDGGAGKRHGARGASIDERSETMTTTWEAIFEVRGMTCDDCARHLARELESVGARDVSVSWQQGEARFGWPNDLDAADLRSAVLRAGYRPGELRRLGGSVGAVESHDDAYDYDLLVLGAGSAAFAAAIKASEAGFRVALVEQGTLGGTCVNVGCVPSKALLAAGQLAWSARRSRFAGVTTHLDAVDLGVLVAQKDELVTRLRQAKYRDLVDEYGFSVIPGHARFSGRDAVVVDGRLVRARRYLVATGASPAVPPIPGLAEAGYLTSTTALTLDNVPARLVVIGANAVGLELGQLFLHVGAEVAFVDMAERIAPFEEPEVSEALAAVLRSEGATIHLGASVRAVRRNAGHIDVTLEVGGRELVLAADEVLVATGRRPNTDGLGLKEAGVAVDGRGAVVVDDELRTSNPIVFAAGDVTGGPQFVYVAGYEGALAAENALLGTGRTVDFTGLPRVIFTEPQVAGAGLTETQARQAGHDVRTSVLPLEAVARALVNRATDGLVKLVAEARSGRLLGASMLADNAGEVIQAAVLAIRHGLTTDELAATFHPYLTMAEGLKLAAQTFSRDVAKLSCCAA
jgi:mercuric reductase